jgi:hypothetical protein
MSITYHGAERYPTVSFAVLKPFHRAFRRSRTHKPR